MAVRKLDDWQLYAGLKNENMQLKQRLEAALAASEAFAHELEGKLEKECEHCNAMRTRAEASQQRLFDAQQALLTEGMARDKAEQRVREYEMEAAIRQTPTYQELQAKNAALAARVADYEEVHEDKKRLCREIGVILHGEGAAKQPSLCDLVGPIEDLKAENAALKDALATVTYKEGALCEIVKEYADLKRERDALAAQVAELEEKLRREDMCTRHALNNLGLMEAESAALTQQVAQEQEAFQILHRSFEAAEAEATRYREALEQLVHQITINDFADSLGHKATGLMALLNAKAALRPREK